MSHKGEVKLFDWTILPSRVYPKKLEFEQTAVDNNIHYWAVYNNKKLRTAYVQQ